MYGKEDTSEARELDSLVHLFNETKRRRDKVEIICENLEGATQNLNKTHIMHKANLDSRMVERYLHFLLERGFIYLTRGKTRTYSITEKGYDLLKKYHKFTRALSC
jgi:predicted transcriptional regulator